ncbi:TIR domain-containing protein [Altererythrobacter salegens]|uniref:TIR domain-containing protein n=1 Tax=Croceibacterium salegens TaxID=1737568 RepID=A0A6I4SR88_9SPHN|nr:TIR domain-containing protein [Croceibacterium salegens]MXO58373.1 TIR domain-containing protein [Croceibacterium salegens]
MSGPDIFLSYNREDAARAKHFADGFAAEGLDVWWDVDLRSGEAYDQVTENALHEAKAVVVLWSPRSVVSRWVRSEATIADQNKTLVPATIEPCRRPVMFELVQTAELSHWNGDAGDPGWQGFVAHVREVLGKPKAAVPSAVPAPPAPKSTQTSVVVLPFANMGGDPEQEYFADGISEDIITDLSKVSSLLVISRNSAFTFKGKHVDIPEVARQLGVTHVLEGSVRRAGNRVRVTAQLIDGKTNGHIWAERFDRDLDDIFALQDELSQEIVKALKVKLRPKERQAIESRETENFELYDVFLRARSAANAAITGEDYTRALELYRKALEVDPDFTPALSGMALMLQQQLVFAPHLRESNELTIERLLARATELGREDASSHLIRATAYLRNRQFALALESYDRAMAASPTYDSEIASVRAVCLLTVGRGSDAIEEAERIRAAGPLEAFNSVFLQFTYHIAGRNAESEAEYERVRDIPTNREVAEHTAFFRNWQMGDVEAARVHIRNYLELARLAWPLMVEYLGSFERPDEALEILRKGMEQESAQNTTVLVLLAFHAGLLGDTKLALEAMRRGTSYSVAMDYLLWWPSLREARQTPEFKQLMRDNGVYDYWRTTGNWGDFARPLGDDDFEIIA